jgi:hypothetical protein
MDVIGTVIGFILGAAGTLATERIRLWLNRPEIRIAFAPDEHCLRFTHAHVGNGARVFETESKYLRLRVSNERRFPAKNCRALLSDFRRYDNGQNSTLLLADTLPLRWAYLGFQPIDLPVRTHFYVDLISALQDRKHFTVELEAQPLVLQNATNAQGKYSFDVSVVGDNFDPVNLRVFLDWKRDWNFEDVWTE